MDRAQTHKDHCAALDCVNDARNTLFCRKHWLLLHQKRKAMLDRFIRISERAEEESGQKGANLQIRRLQCMALMVREVAYIEGRREHNLPEVSNETGEIIKPPGFTTERIIKPPVPHPDGYLTSRPNGAFITDPRGGRIIGG